MRKILLLLAVLSAGASTLAEAQGDPAAGEAPSREALLRAAVGRDRGEITAMEPNPVKGQGVVIGYSSGAVLRCYGENICEEFGGTPNIAVQHLAVSRRGQVDITWVSYSRGALYQCVDRMCTRFVWHAPPGE